MKAQRIKLALVCTIGGHFEQLTNLSDLYDHYDHFWITNHNKQTVSQLADERRYFVPQAHYKKPWTYLQQLPGIFRILIQEKPTHIISTGSGRTAFVPYLLSWAMRIKFLYVDTFSRVKGYSKFGTFLLKIGHPFFSQWEDRKNRRVRHIGPIFKQAPEVSKNPEADYIFVAVGTRTEPFTRLLEAVDKLVQKGTILHKVIIQGGHTHYPSEHIEVFDFCTPDEIDELIQHARFVITQESAGIGTKCLKFNTKFIVMPRDYQFGELPAQSDMNEDLHLKLAEMGYTCVVHDKAQLEAAIQEIDTLKCGFEFDNHKAITILKKELEAKCISPLLT